MIRLLLNFGIGVIHADIQQIGAKACYECTSSLHVLNQAQTYVNSVEPEVGDGWSCLYDPYPNPNDPTSCNEHMVNHCINYQHVVIMSLRS